MNPNRRQLLSGIATAGLPRFLRAPRREVLPNGIVLPTIWPPRDVDVTTRDPVPNLTRIPNPILCGSERQLFVDDFILASMSSGISRAWHTPVARGENPVLTADQPWERPSDGTRWAMPTTDGIEDDGAGARMWYRTGSAEVLTCLAETQDGLSWRKPALDVVPGTNIVGKYPRDAGSICVDRNDAPARRYKWFRSLPGSQGQIFVHTSPDGVHWSGVLNQTPLMADPLFITDANSVFYNPFRRKWVFSIRSHNSMLGRFRRYWETDDVLAPIDWSGSNAPVPWTYGDKEDIANIRPDATWLPQLYNLVSFKYESVLVGLFALYTSAPNEAGAGRPKINEVYIGFSRDGFYWSRLFRRPFIGVSEDRNAWNWGNAQPIGDGFIRRGDVLRFLVTGRTEPSTMSVDNPGSVAGVGAFDLPVDGFTGLAGTGTAETRTLKFDRNLSEFCVNARAGSGQVDVAVLDEAGRQIPSLAETRCLPVRYDGSRQVVRWSGGDFARVAGQPIRLRFRLRDAELLSFWAEPRCRDVGIRLLGAGDADACPRSGRR